MAASSTELVSGYKYAKADGTTTSGSKTFKGCDADIDAQRATNAAKKYSKAVNGTLVSGQLKTVEDLDVT